MATFVYDGDCAFCSSCARFIQRRIPTAAQIVAWQHADLTSLRLTRQACIEAVQWVSPAEVSLAGPDAIAALLRSSNFFWRTIGRFLGLPIVRPLSWPIYRWISRNRDRLPGGSPACAVPPTSVGR